MLTVDADHAGSRLDQFLAITFPEHSRSLLKRLIVDGRVTVNGAVGRPADRLRSGDGVLARFDFPPSLTAQPEEIDLNVVYQDESMAVIDKPPGLVVHPSAGHAGGTLVNALLHRFPALLTLDSPRPGIVHRLDKDTSGLMVVALSAAAQANLSSQMKQRAIRREYLALVSGRPEARPHVVDAPIGRDNRNRLRMGAGPNTIAPRAARTYFQVEEFVGKFTLVRARLETGRTHQVRVHLALAGYPVAGDTLYGGERVPGLGRQFLHAVLLELNSTVSGERQLFESPLPPDLATVLDTLRRAE